MTDDKPQNPQRTAVLDAQEALEAARVAIKAYQPGVND